MRGKNKNILLVEDSSDDVELIKRKFNSSRISCKLVIAKNGEEALDYIYRRRKYVDKERFPDPNLIILDIRMPKVNGIEVLKEIKSNEKIKDVPVIMFTVSTIEKDLLDSFDIGCEHYVAKSVGFEKFKDTLEPIIKHYLMK